MEERPVIWWLIRGISCRLVGISFVSKGVFFTALSPLPTFNECEMPKPILSQSVDVGPNDTAIDTHFGRRSFRHDIEKYMREVPIPSS